MAWPLKSAFAALAMLTAAPVQATGEEPAAPAPQRELLFADEFNGQELDREKWVTVGPDFWVNNEQQAYIDDPAVIGFVQGIAGADGGVLMLRPLYQFCPRLPWTSGQEADRRRPKWVSHPAPRT